MENVILEKTCNAFYPEAKVGTLFSWSIAAAITSVFKSSQGGIWVGGTFRANQEWLYFQPNILNTVAHKNADQVNIHVSELRNIRRESAWVTDIVVIEHARGQFKFRCYGAEQVVSTLMSYYFRQPVY